MKVVARQIIIVPCHFLSALFNDDTSSLNNDEVEKIEQFKHDISNSFENHLYSFSLVTETNDETKEPYFTKWHDMMWLGVKAADCLDVEILCWREI